MNSADLLLANLERLLSSPTSAETIRKLIFDLAIRGQLTTQSDKDEPASVLIAKVIRTAQVEDRKFSAEPAVTERPFELPSGWEWVRLGNTGKIFNGTSASAGEKARLSKTADGLPFIATKDVGYGRDPLSYENGLKVPHGDKDYKVAKSGAVLICAEGGSAGKKVGQTNRPICFGNKLYANETWAGIEAGYILSLYQSSFFYGEFKAKMTGIIGGIARSDFRSLRIPLPPLAEQKRIVAKVDELMALCDRLEAQLMERDVKQAALAKAALAKFTENPTPENLQLLFHPSFTIEPGDLRTLVLEFAIRGKLVPQDKSDETAAELLARIIDKSAKGNSKKSKTGEVHNEIVGDFPIPQNWIWSELGKVFDVRDGTHDTPAYTAKGFPLITSKNIYGGSLSFEGAKLISKEDHLHISERSKVAQGDILFAMIGSIGNPVIVNTDIDFSIKNLALFKYHSRVDSEPRFLLLYLRLVEKAMKAEAAGGVQSFVSLGYLRKYRFPLPPLSEQERIASRVETLFAQIDNLEAQLEASRTTGEKLLEAMVAELTSA